MAKKTATLETKITGDSAQFEKTLHSARRSVDRFAADTRNRLRRIGNDLNVGQFTGLMAGGFGVAAIGAGALAAAVGVGVKNVADLAGDMDDLSANTGLGAGEAAVLAQGLKLAGLEGGNLLAFTSKLRNKIEEAGVAGESLSDSLSENNSARTEALQDAAEATKKAKQSLDEALKEDISKLGLPSFEAKKAPTAAGNNALPLLSGDKAQKAALSELQKQYSEALKKIDSDTATNTAKINKAFDSSSDKLRKSGDKAASVFSELGLSVDDLRKMDDAQALKALQKAFMAIEDQGARTRLAIDLFGKSGAAALNFLTDPKVLGLAAQQLGGVAPWLDENAKALADLGDRVDGLRWKIVGLFAGGTGNAAPAFAGVLDRLEKIDLMPLGESLGAGISDVLDRLAAASDNGNLGEAIGTEAINAVEGAASAAIDYLGEAISGPVGQRLITVAAEAGLEFGSKAAEGIWRAVNPANLFSGPKRDMVSEYAGDSLNPLNIVNPATKAKQLALSAGLGFDFLRGFFGGGGDIGGGVNAMLGDPALVTTRTELAPAAFDNRRPSDVPVPQLFGGVFEDSSRKLDEQNELMRANLAELQRTNQTLASMQAR